MHLLAAVALLLSGPAAAPSSPCGKLSLTFLEDTPERALYPESDEFPPRAIGQMQSSVDGSRSMQSHYWSVGYRVLPTGADGRGVQGESYWATGAKSPMLDLELQRDRHGLVIREIVRTPAPPPESGSPKAPGRILGWYEYVRNEPGQLRRLIYHSPVSQDPQLPSDEDPIQSIVEIDYGPDGRNPHEAAIYGPIPRRGGGPRAAIHFDYDAAGRLVGGARQGLWPAYFRVTSGACQEVPERLFVILLGAHGGPWQPFDFSMQGAWPAGPR